MNLGPLCKFVTKNPVLLLRELFLFYLKGKHSERHVDINGKHRSGCPANKICLAGEVFGIQSKSFEKSAQAGFQSLLSRTHQFASHSLPGGGVLSQVDFPK